MGLHQTFSKTTIVSTNCEWTKSLLARLTNILLLTINVLRSTLGAVEHR